MSRLRPSLWLAVSFMCSITGPTPTRTSSELWARSSPLPGVRQRRASGADPMADTPDDPSHSFPIYAITSNERQMALCTESRRQHQHSHRAERHRGFIITTPFQLSPISGQTGAIGRHRCRSDVPSRGPVKPVRVHRQLQRFYGHRPRLTNNDGNSTPLSQSTKAKDSYAIPGPAAWCVVTGRTS